MFKHARLAVVRGDLGRCVVPRQVLNALFRAVEVVCGEHVVFELGVIGEACARWRWRRGDGDDCGGDGEGCWQG